MTKGTNDVSATKPTASRRVIHATCTEHGGSRGFTNMVMTKVGGRITLDPHATGACVIELDETEATAVCVLSGLFRILETNPARYLELLPTSRPKAVVWTQARVALWRATDEHPKVAVWTVQQTARFLHHIRHHRLYPLSPWSGCAAAKPAPCAGAT